MKAKKKQQTVSRKKSATYKQAAGKKRFVKKRAKSRKSKREGKVKAKKTTALGSYSFLDFIQNKGLESSQRVAAQELDRFLISSERCFILQGYAGTGKTFLLGLLNDYLKRMKRRRVLMAPTGRAARILGQTTESKASTIHSVLYQLDSFTFRERGILFTYNFPLRELPREDFDLVAIADEASLISDTIPPVTKFMAFGYGVGTGALLTDLITYLKLGDNEWKTKLILVGDPCQLRPVQDAISPALDEDYLVSKKGLAAKRTTLTDIVRQSKKSGIVKAATSIREGINRNFLSFLSISENGRDVIGVGRTALISKAVSSAADPKAPQFIVVTYGNQQAFEFNSAVRQGLGRSEICSGDRLVLCANNKAFEMLNGGFLEVIKVALENEKILQTVPGIEKPVALYFREIDVEYDDEHGVTRTRTVKLLENALSESSVSDISDGLRNALFSFLRERYRRLAPTSKASKILLRDDPYFNAIRAKYGYALTCHKAQGGEWSEVGVIFGSRDDIYSMDLCKWAYTAITRAKKKVFLEDAPEIHPLTKIHLGSRREDKTRVSARVVSKYGIIPEDDFLVLFLEDVLSPLKITIKEKLPQASALRITFIKGEIQTLIQFYKRKNSFSSAQLLRMENSDTALGEEIFAALSHALLPK